MSLVLSTATAILLASPPLQPPAVMEPRGVDEDAILTSQDVAPTLADADRSRRRWWSLDLGLGPALAISDYGWARGAGLDPISADVLGPAARIAVHRQRQRRVLYIGGGPFFSYSAWRLRDSPGAHAGSVGAELLLGGGGDRILVYGHGQAGVGIGYIAVRPAVDGERSAYGVTFLPRLAAGIGVRGYLGPRRRVSLGGLVDYVVIAGVDAYLTLGLHFR